VTTPADSTDLRYDPYDTDIYADPYPVFRRLREEAPLYYDERYDFYAVSRFDDVERGLVDRETFISSRGDVLEAIKDGIQGPPGFFIFDDPPVYTMYRGLLARAFTPKQMRELEPKIRALCASALDPLVGADRIDFVADVGSQVPMRAIGMLLGIPESGQQERREEADARLRTEPGKPRDYSQTMPTGASFAEYLDWRAEHPSDDLVTELLHAEFEDVDGTRRTLTKEELLVFVNLLFGAGNETTNRLIGWTAKLFSDHPDQRRALAADPVLVPNAIEEVLRFESPALQTARYVDRVVLEEVLTRFPDWEVDAAEARLVPSTVRGWETLPAYIGTS
jgi:cytochrome P450